MDTPVLQKPKTMAELLPGLSGILSKEARQALTVLKQPRPTIATTLTVEKPFRPMTFAEMKADIKVLKVPSPRRTAPKETSTKKNWNSSVKVKKTISMTESNHIKSIHVRKVLNFQNQQIKPKIPIQNTAPNARKTLNPSTPKFARPEVKAKRSLHPLAESKASSILSISGICHIEETPLLVKEPAKTRMPISNKENISNQPIAKIAATPKSSLLKKMMASRIPDTPLSNESWKSSCNDSFIQNEKDIELMENETKPLTELNTFKDVVKVSPPASTPYKEYRNVNEFFNDTSKDTSSAVYHDNTIMSFDTTSGSKENNRREESVIVSLCDMLNKATVTKKNTEKVSTDLDDLLVVEKQTANNLAMIENGIAMLKNIKESELKSLQSVRKLIDEKRKQASESEKETTVIETTKEIPIHDLTPKSQVAKPCSVIKSCLKSPSYKIPNKRSSVRKKVHYSSLPNVANLKLTPEKNMGCRALSMYLQMKKHMNFLSTPAGKKRPTGVVMDTPAVASHNLQKQLDKLYDES